MVCSLNKWNNFGNPNSATTAAATELVLSPKPKAMSTKSNYAQQHLSKRRFAGHLKKQPFWQAFTSPRAWKTLSWNASCNPAWCRRKRWGLWTLLQLGLLVFPYRKTGLLLPKFSLFCSKWKSVTFTTTCTCWIQRFQKRILRREIWRKTPKELLKRKGGGLQQSLQNGRASSLAAAITTQTAVEGLPERKHKDKALAKLGVMEYEHTHIDQDRQVKKARLLECPTRPRLAWTRPRKWRWRWKSTGPKTTRSAKDCCYLRQLAFGALVKLILPSPHCLAQATPQGAGGLRSSFSLGSSLRCTGSLLQRAWAIRLRLQSGVLTTFEPLQLHQKNEKSCRQATLKSSNRKFWIWIFLVYSQEQYIQKFQKLSFWILGVWLAASNPTEIELFELLGFGRGPATPQKLNRGTFGSLVGWPRAPNVLMDGLFGGSAKTIK